MSDSESPRTIDFDFSTVIPEALVARQWDQPYDRDWVSLNIPTIKRRLFDEAATSKLKLVNLMRGGALEIGDSFEVGVVDATGHRFYRFPDLVGRVLSGRNVGCPIIRMPNFLHGDPPAADYIVKGPVDIVRLTLSHYGHPAAHYNPQRSGWTRVVIYDAMAWELDSLYDTRQDYALWLEIVDWYTEKHGLQGRKRKRDPYTGEIIKYPALMIKKP